MNNVNDLLKHLKDLGARLYVFEGKIKLDIKKQFFTPEISDKIKEYKEQILKLIEDTAGFSFDKIDTVSIQDNYAMSDAQRRLWLISQFDESKSAYNLPGNLYLDSNVDIVSFIKALNSVVDRHEILRTVFKENQNGEIRQWILSKDEVGFQIEEFDFRTKENKNELIQQILDKDANKEFNLKDGPNFTAGLIQLEDHDYIFYYNMHHIISDGWSLNIFFRDLRIFHDAYKEGRSPELLSLQIQYKDYSAWQLKQLSDGSFDQHRNYWLENLAGELPILNLPTTLIRPKIKTYEGQSVENSIISPAVTRKLKKYALDHGGSDFMVIHAAWNILLYRYTSQTDFIIGTPISGRVHVDMKEQIGFYVNTLAIRNQIDSNDSFDEVFKKVRTNMMNAYSHQLYPFNRLVEELKVTRDISRSPIFDMMIVYNNETESGGENDQLLSTFQGMTELNFGPSKFDIEIGFNDTGGDFIKVWGVFNPLIYEKEMMDGLMGHFKKLLKILMDDTTVNISEIDFLDIREREKILMNFNDNKVEYPTINVLELFQNQVLKSPEKIALICGDRNLNFLELDQVSNQFANYLVDKLLIKSQDFIGIKLARNEWMIIAVLGVLKAGGAYVPIDISYPQMRIDFIEKDTNCKISIDENELRNFIDEMDLYSNESTNLIGSEVNTAYVIYTSGSTGIPKGVMITHNSFSSFINWSHAEFLHSTFEKVFFATSLNFDLSIFEIFHPLTCGKSLVILENGLEIPDQLKIHQKVLLNTVPSVIGSLLHNDLSFGNIALINLAGEPIPKWIRLALMEKGIEVRNLYGPSEDTTYSTFVRIDEDSRDIIGKPIANTQIYILNNRELIQPIGVFGEIHISGDGLAKGYLNQEKLTQEKFVPNPFNKGSRMYKTGDIGRWLPDGNIEFIGRIDNQVKVRGYRIELGEIAHALITLDQIIEGYATVIQNKSGEGVLIGYFTSEIELDSQTIRVQLKKLLPDYMIPIHFIKLEQLPLTPNGKVDKSLLPIPEGIASNYTSEFVAPTNETEIQLVKIWESVLERANIGIKDDFFELGGHSLKAVKILFKINAEFHSNLKIANIFGSPTIEELAYSLDFARNQQDMKLRITNLKEIEL